MQKIPRQAILYRRTRYETSITGLLPSPNSHGPIFREGGRSFGFSIYFAFCGCWGLNPALAQDQIKGDQSLTGLRGWAVDLCTTRTLWEMIIWNLDLLTMCQPTTTTVVCAQILLVTCFLYSYEYSLRFRRGLHATARRKACLQQRQ